MASADSLAGSRDETLDAVQVRVRSIRPRATFDIFDDYVTLEAL
jgi:hypothetical protein